MYQSPTSSAFSMPAEEPLIEMTQSSQPPSQGPHCHLCGGATMRNGTCWVCIVCGTTTGCSVC